MNWSTAGIEGMQTTPGAISKDIIFYTFATVE
jgi:hypothetical protein